VQETPAGIAQALTIAADHWGEGPVALVLGDNIFFGHGWSSCCARPRRAGAAPPCSRITSTIPSVMACSNSTPRAG
jgi:UTP-glucose-1-phosphate uridylyltransferase